MWRRGLRSRLDRHTLRASMEDIARGAHQVEYLEPCFADGRGNAGSLKKAPAGVDGTVVEYVPWMATEVHYKTIEPYTIAFLYFLYFLLVSRSQTIFPRQTFAKIGSGAVALRSWCCRLYDERTTKTRMSMALLTI